MTDYDKGLIPHSSYGESNPSEIEGSVWNRLKNACRVGNHWNVLNGLNDRNGVRLFGILGKTKANAVPSGAGAAPDPVRRAQVHRVAAPGTATHHALAA